MMQKQKDWFVPVTIGVGVLLVAGGIGLYLIRNDEMPAEPVADIPEPSLSAPPSPAAPPVATAPPPVRALPLPPLDQSDTEIVGGLTELLGSQAVMQHLVPERVVRNLVVSIDNVPRQQLALNQRPFKATPGDFVTSGEEDSLVISPENFERYEPFVALVSSLDAKTFVAFYRGLEPLFQQAYEELGHPNASFRARLNEVIQHLLQTPTPRGPIALVRPSVVYKYADERLENLSAGQKILIRMGVDNATVIKGKLREIQAELL